MSRREILKEIDATLDQLIKNAAALQEVKGDPLYTVEVDALNKAQESLLARLLHLDQFLKKDASKKRSRAIEDKRAIFSELTQQSPRRHTKTKQKI